MRTAIVFVIRNFNKYKTKTVRIEYSPEMREHLNFRMPVTEVINNVSPRTDKSIMQFIKTRPFEEWGPLDKFKIVIEDETLDGKEDKIY